MTAQQTIMVYRLQDAGDVALHIAEVEGFDDKSLAAAIMFLYDYERKRGYLADRITRGVYTFVRHDKRSTKAFEITSMAGEELGQQKTNALTRAVLSSVAQSVFTLFLKPDMTPVGATYLEAVTPGAQLGVSHFARYLA